MKVVLSFYILSYNSILKFTIVLKYYLMCTPYKHKWLGIKVTIRLKLIIIMRELILSSGKNDLHYGFLQSISPKL